MKSAKIIYYLKSEKMDKVTGKAPIYARITVNGKRANISINRSVEPERWTKTNKLENARNPEEKEIWHFLESKKHQIKQAEREVIESKIPFTADNIKKVYDGEKVEVKPVTLMDACTIHNQKFNALVGVKERAEGTFKRYETLKKLLQYFMLWEFKKKDMPLIELKNSFLLQFDFYLRTVRKCNNNTTVKYCRNFTKIINYAVDFDMLENYPFKKYKGKTNKVKKQSLNLDELKTIMNKEFPTPRLEIIRDIFLFSAYTGYAYAEVLKLSPFNICTRADGEKWIEISRTKTKATQNVLLLPPALEMIEKYKFHPIALQRGTVFPVPTNQRVNAYLKEIADVCGILKTLTFHIGRHSFITNMSELGMPTEAIRVIASHATIKETEGYMDSTEKSAGEEMKKVRTKLYPLLDVNMNATNPALN